MKIMILLDILERKKKTHKDKKEKIEFINLNESDNENANKSNNHSNLLSKKKIFTTINFSNQKH